MNLIDARVNWMFGWANRPRLEITVDRIPKLEEMEFDLHVLGDDHTLYWAEKDGYVSFFSHSTRNERGYGGREYVLNLKGKQKTKIKGPWSSRAGAMNNYFPHSVDVTIYEKEGDHPSLGFSAHVALDFACRAANIAGCTLERQMWHDDLVFEIIGKDEAFDKEVDILLEKAEDRAATYESAGAGKACAEDLMLYCDEIAQEEQMQGWQAIAKEAKQRIHDRI